MMKTLEENRALVSAMIEVVNEKGLDYVYPDYNCVYFDEYGCPSCMVGHAFAKIDVTDEHINNLVIPNNHGTRANSTDALRVLEQMGYHTAVAQALSSAQRIQDGRHVGQLERGTWGEALASMIRTLDRFGMLDELIPNLPDSLRPTAR